MAGAHASDMAVVDCGAVELSRGVLKEPGESGRQLYKQSCWIVPACPVVVMHSEAASQLCTAELPRLSLAPKAFVNQQGTSGRRSCGSPPEEQALYRGKLRDQDPTKDTEVKR